jgi:hypothetical protein
MPSFRYVINAAAPPETILDRLGRDVGAPGDDWYNTSRRRGFEPYPFGASHKITRFYGHLDANSFEILRSGSWVMLSGQVVPAGDGSRLFVHVKVWPSSIIIAFLLTCFLALDPTVDHVLSIPREWTNPGADWNWIFLAMIIPVLIVTFAGAVKAKNELAAVIGLAVAEHRLHIDLELLKGK